MFVPWVRGQGTVATVGRVRRIYCKWEDLSLAAELLLVIVGIREAELLEFEAACRYWRGLHW